MKCFFKCSWALKAARHKTFFWKLFYILNLKFKYVYELKIVYLVVVLFGFLVFFFFLSRTFIWCYSAYTQHREQLWLNDQNQISEWKWWQHFIRFRVGRWRRYFFCSWVSFWTSKLKMLVVLNCVDCKCVVFEREGDLKLNCDGTCQVCND